MRSGGVRSHRRVGTLDETAAWRAGRFAAGGGGGGNQNKAGSLNEPRDAPENSDHLLRSLRIIGPSGEHITKEFLLDPGATLNAAKL